MQEDHQVLFGLGGTVKLEQTTQEWNISQQRHFFYDV